VLNNIEAFYGKTLVHSYCRQPQIECIGLFIETHLLDDCDIFFTEPYDTQCHFVHLMQSLDLIRFEGEGYPITPELIIPMGYEWELAYNFTYLKQIHRHMNDPGREPHVRVKYSSTWQMIRTRHKTLLDTLETNNFDPRSISDLDWTEAMSRVQMDDIR
jgi:hypothetical protein